MPLDRDAVRRVVDLLAESGVGELEIDDGDMSVRARRAMAAAAPVVVAAEPQPAEDEPAVPCAVDAGDDQPEDTVAKPTAPTNYIVAKMVGLFHHGASPEAEALVAVGDEVSQGQVVATIEALRKLTEVTSPVDGQILEVLVDDGEAVQFGQKLFAVGASLE